MSSEIIFKTYVIEKDGLFKPFVIVGSSNAFDMYSNKIARNNYDILKSKGINRFLSKNEIEPILAKDFEAMDDSGCYRGLQKTKKGYINSFFKTVISEDQFIEDGERMEDFLKRNAPKKKRMNEYDYVQLGKDKPVTKFLKFDNKSVKDIGNKRIIAYRSEFGNGTAIGVGKIKDIGNGEFGFVRMGKRKSYTPLFHINDYSFI